MSSLREGLQQELFSLTLSAGFFRFFAHAEVLSALEDEKLLPAAIMGASAGALVARVWSAELPSPEIRELLFSLDRDEFWEPAFGPESCEQSASANGSLQPGP